MRIKEPVRTTALIFKTGKMVITGAKSEIDSRTAAQHYANHIGKVGFKTKLDEFKVQNMVGSCSVKHGISLESLMLKCQESCTYNPDTFPGLIFHMKQPKVCLLIFTSGKIVLTGAKTKAEIDLAF